MACDTNMPCNAYNFDSGVCGLAFILNTDFFGDVHDNMTKPSFSMVIVKLQLQSSYFQIFQRGSNTLAATNFITKIPMIVVPVHSIQI